MEHLQYVIEDSTIAYLLGVNNFTNDESAILELVKNSYDAGALHVNISFSGDQLVIADDGQGMDENNIRTAWMHVGKSDKSYEIFDANNRKRVLAGSQMKSSGVGCTSSTIISMICRGVRNWPFRPAVASLPSIYSYRSPCISRSAMSWV